MHTFVRSFAMVPLWAVPLAVGLRAQEPVKPEAAPQAAANASAEPGLDGVRCYRSASVSRSVHEPSLVVP